MHHPILLLDIVVAEQVLDSARQLATGFLVGLVPTVEHFCHQLFPDLTAAEPEELGELGVLDNGADVPVCLQNLRRYEVMHSRNHTLVDVLSGCPVNKTQQITYECRVLASEVCV